jgi:hypothetical protein
MADVVGHVAAAQRAAQALKCLRVEDEKKHQAWIATIAFYEALHWIAAVASALGIAPATSHQARSDQLADDRRLAKYLHPHEKLLNASLIARYLSDDRGNTAERFFGQTNILYRILGDWLHSVRSHAKLDLAKHGYPVAEATPLSDHAASPKSGMSDKR